MKSRAALPLALLLATLLSSLPARGDSGPRLRLDRAVAEPSIFAGFARLRLYATAVTLQGGFVPHTGKKAFALKIGSSRKKIPYLVGAFAGTNDPLAIAIVLHRGFEYAENWAEIKSAFTPLLESLPKDARVAIVSYADSVDASGFVSPKAALKKLASITAETVPADNELIKAIERATRLLDRFKVQEPATDARKFIIALSDGKDIDPEPKRYRKAGEKAAKKNIRIHSVAFSPDDIRGPLRGLGELSKRSFGTFRWVRGEGLFGAQFTALATEVARQYVLTFFVRPKDIDGKRLSVVAGDIESNKLKVKVACGDGTCSGDQYCNAARCVTRASSRGGGVLVWVLAIVGGLVGLLILLAVVGYFMSRRQRPVPMPTAVAVGGAAPPQPPTDNRIVAFDSQGRPLGGPGTAGHPVATPQTAGHQAVHAPAHSPANAPPPTATPTIVIVSGPGAGQTIPIAHGATIGTHPSCQVHLAGDGFASGVHAQILFDTAGNVSIVDKGSTNGTFVNGVRTQHHALAHGNSIKIGGATLRFLRN